MNQVTPNEIARRLGITGLQFRNWLRDKWRAGDPRFADHRINDRWSFSVQLAAELEREYRTEHGGRGTATGVRPAAASTAKRSTTRTEAAREQATSVWSVGSGHRVTVTIDGEEVETLEDLLRQGLLAVVIGINPAPASVAAGHYWQGRTGATLWRRLRVVGLLSDEIDGFEDDAALAAGVGFTDVVKRPTPSAAEVSDDELSAGRTALEAKLVELEVPLVIFAFKKAATTLFGDFAGNGFIDSCSLGTSRVFVMPGPYEASDTASSTLETLAAWVRASRK